MRQKELQKRYIELIFRSGKRERILLFTFKCDLVEENEDRKDDNTNFCIRYVFILSLDFRTAGEF